MKPGLFAFAITVVALALGLDMWLWQKYPMMGGPQADAQGHGIISPFHNRPAVDCPCLVQPVHIKARRWHAPAAPVVAPELTCKRGDMMPPTWIEDGPGTVDRPVLLNVPIAPFYYAGAGGGGYDSGYPPIDPPLTPPSYSVPEPSPLALMVGGLLIVAARRVFA